MEGGLLLTHPALQPIARIIVLAAGAALVGFGVFALFCREPAERFLSGFASSRRAHLTEHVLRLLVGVAFVLNAPSMHYPSIFAIFGWVLTISSAILLLLPWRWHQRYGEWAIPWAIRFCILYAIGALLIGCGVLAAAL